MHPVSSSSTWSLQHGQNIRTAEEERDDLPPTPVIPAKIRIHKILLAGRAPILVRALSLWEQDQRAVSAGTKRRVKKKVFVQVNIDTTPNRVKCLKATTSFFFFFFLPPHSTRLVITVSEGGGGKKFSIPNHQTCDLLNQLVSSRTVVCLKVWITGHYVSYNVYNVDITYNIVCFFIRNMCKDILIRGTSNIWGVKTESTRWKM